METIDLIQENVEYELVSICWQLNYDFDMPKYPSLVQDDTNEELYPLPPKYIIEYDEKGIPKGQSIEEIRIRQRLISEYIHKWSAMQGSERKVFNEILQEPIYIVGVSVAEMIEHSAKSYKSTKAALMFEDVLKKAYPYKRVSTKKDDANQKGFLFMLIMIYKIEELGTIKVSLGVKSDKNAQQIETLLKKYQYGITVLGENEPIIKQEPEKRKRKAPHRKR